MSSLTINLSPEDIDAIAAAVAERIAPAPKPERDELVDEKQAALELDVSIKTLQSWRHRQRGPVFVKVGRAVRYRRRDIERFVRSVRP